MHSEEYVCLACPYCQAELHQPLAWFRRPYFSCPACGGGLAAGQFAALVEDLESAFEASVATMLRGEAGCSCGGGGCGGHH